MNSITEVIKGLKVNYSGFIDYINGLTTDEFLYAYKNKWTAGQQLKHIALCVQPLVQVFSMPKELIVKTFGASEESNKSYNILLSEYLDKLNHGGIAPNQYVPENISEKEKSELLKVLSILIETLCSKIENFTDKELNSLRIPHPLLGNITLREMLYNAVYHVEHHQKQTEDNLNFI